MMLKSKQMKHRMNLQVWFPTELAESKGSAFHRVLLHLLSCPFNDPKLDILLSNAEHFQRLRPPNVLLTTCYKPSGIMYKFLAEMLEVLPCATYYKRQVHTALNNI